MAIYLRTCPTTKTRMLGYLGALAAAGIALLYPLILLMTAFALGALDEAVDYPEGNESIANAATAVGATLEQPPASQARTGGSPRTRQ